MQTSSSNNAQFDAPPPRSCKTDTQAAQQESCESIKTPDSFRSYVKHVIGAHLKKATREMERSSEGVRDEANIDLSTAGVTGIFLGESGGAGEMFRELLDTDITARSQL